MVWEWDGRADSIVALAQHEVGICGPLYGERGCLMRLDGYDPWIEIVLDATQSAALANGASVELRCTCLASLEHTLRTRASRFRP